MELIFISEIIVAGITKAGTTKNINEDSFQCMRHIYPDTLDRSEIQVGKAIDHWQIYSVTDGMGGSGIGDIAGRLVQEVLIKQVTELKISDANDFDFADFAEKYLKAVLRHLKERLTRYQDKPVGCSLAFVLINGDKAYTFSIGTNRIYLIRDGRIYKVTQDHRRESGKPSLYLGNFTNNDKLTPQNLNKIQMFEGDEIILMSDGVYQNYSDQEILDVSLNATNLVKGVRDFELDLSKRPITDDHTVLALRVNSVLAQIPIEFQDDLPDVMEGQSVTINQNKDDQSYEDNIWLNHHDEAFSISRVGHDDYVGNFVEAEREPSLLIQALKLFGSSFSIGILIGILLVLVFRVFVIGF